MAHANARLTPYGRQHLVELHQQGYRPAVIAHMVGVSRTTVYRWLGRYRVEGEAGLSDRPSCPHASPRRLPEEQVADIRDLRLERAWGPHRIGYALHLARSTVYAVLRRLGLHRLASLHRSTRQIVRYERSTPGELVHLDVKKLGRIPDGGGKRFDPGFAETGAGRHSGRAIGHDFIHIAIDDYSRYAYAKALPDERGDTTAGFLDRALSSFKALGVRVDRTDNGKNYTHTSLPPADQRQGRGIQQDAAARMGLHPHVRLEQRAPCRPPCVSCGVQYETPTHRARRPLTDRADLSVTSVGTTASAARLVALG
jgi:transposase